MTVLIVDDDVCYAYAVLRTLKHLGREALVCDDWTVLLDRVERDPDVASVILDLRLPAGTPNGVALGHLVKARRLDVRLVFVTAHGDLLAAVPDLLGSKFDKSAAITEIVAAA